MQHMQTAKYFFCRNIIYYCWFSCSRKIVTVEGILSLNISLFQYLWLAAILYKTDETGTLCHCFFLWCLLSFLHFIEWIRFRNDIQDGSLSRILAVFNCEHSRECCYSVRTQISGSYIFDSRRRIYYHWHHNYSYYANHIQYSQMHYLNKSY